MDYWTKELGANPRRKGCFPLNALNSVKMHTLRQLNE